jgi:hypothetical protein
MGRVPVPGTDLSLRPFALPAITRTDDLQSELDYTSTCQD